MNIAIVGSGQIGARLGTAWRRKGHTVTFAARDPADSELQNLCNSIGASAKALSQALPDAEVVAIAVPYGAVDDVIRAIPNWTGKVVIDCTNAVERGMTLKYGHTTSSAEELAKKLPGAHLVKSFNAQGAENLAEPSYNGVPATNFYCGDDPQAKQIVRTLIEDIGLEAMDAGPLKNARLLEPLMLLWVACSQSLGTRNIAFKLLRR
jgi:8-hydroxy-5-deazaflavin:NADPH oxidoreductase